jgi:hypothetical protein
MRLAILGNSHTACLLHALNARPDLGRGLDITFYAAIGRNMNDFAVAEGCLVPQTDLLRTSLQTTSGGADRIDPARHDAVLTIGLNYNLPPVSTRLSHAVQQAVLRNLVRSSVAWKLAGLLRQVSDIPVHVAHTPLRASDITAHNEHVVTQVLSYDRVLEETQAHWSELDVRGLRQPDHTRYRDVLTRRNYSRDSRGLRGAGLLHDSGDRSHMNEEFGADLLLSARAAMGLG